MSEETWLLEEIQSQPNDEAPWLVFADWLEDQGDLRGELVRLRHELSRRIDVEQRAAQEARLQQLLYEGVQPVTPTVVNSLGLQLALISPGTFLMGSPETEVQREPDEDQVTVAVTNGFYLGTTVVTQGHWVKVMDTEPWREPWDPSASVRVGPTFPVTCIPWSDAQKFCDELTEQEQASGRLAQNWRYEMPTEAQWEYACRAGTTTPYFCGNRVDVLKKFAWFRGNAYVVHPVQQTQPNPWGLYDMHGNVWEWCQDSYERRLPAGSDPVGRGGSERVMRGGCWFSDVDFCRSAARNQRYFLHHREFLGFRLAMTCEQGTTPSVPFTPDE